MLFVLVELVCILKYKLNKSYLCLTYGQFLSSLIQPLRTSKRIMGVVECLDHEIRKMWLFTMSTGFYHFNPVKTSLNRMSGRNRFLPAETQLCTWH